MANQNFRVKKGLEVGLGATFLYADDTGVGINSAAPRHNLDVRGTAQAEKLIVDNDIQTGSLVGTAATITNINADGIVAAAATITNLNFNDGVGSGLTVTNIEAVTGQFETIIFEDTGGGGGGGISSDGQTGITSQFITTKDLYITGVATFTSGVTTSFLVQGVSTHVGMATFQDNVFIDGNLDVKGSVQFTDIGARDLLVTGVGSITTLEANVGIITVANLGITTTYDITVYNQLKDSLGQVGAADSILATVGGKLTWTRPDLVGIATGFDTGNTFYVSENGNDNNSGVTFEKPFKTIAYALTQITPGANQILQVSAGEYEEVFPLSIPIGVTVRGAGQRATLIKPTTATETNDCFLLDDRTTVEDLTIGGMYKPQGAANNNYAFRFKTGADIQNRSPYVQRVTVINRGTQVTASDPYGYGSADAYPTTAPGGGGVLVDGSVVTSASLEAAILLNEVTLFPAGNIGIEMTNGARVEWLNGFIYFASEGVKGQADLTTGLHGAGKARLSLDNASGGLTPGNDIIYYDSDGTTQLASGTIDSVSGNYVYLTNAGVGTFAVPFNRTAKNVSFVDGAQISTAQQKFGTASLDCTSSSTDAINIDTNADFGFGTGDFTIDFWIYQNATGNNKTFLDMRKANDSDVALSLQEVSGATIDVEISGSAVITGTQTLTQNVWHHIALTREGSTLRLFVDGVADGSVTNSTDLGLDAPFRLGDKHDNTGGIPAFFDEVRVQKGVAKYTAAFTPATTEHQGDKDTVLLLHFNDANGATSTTDDILVYQDIRITGGNTADKVTLADYHEFGADLRSVACAIEYGNKGIIGDGNGVTLRVISINFNHVGALGDITNDPNLAIQANEVTEINGGEVSYVSIDQKGDLRVGDAFFVNQETGEVSFQDTVTDLTALSSLTITNGSQSSIITPTSGRFGNVLISGQSVESVTGDLDLKAAGNGEINIYGDTNVIGVLTAQVIEINAIQNGNTSIALDDTGPGSGVIRFNTDGVEAMRLDESQHLGIGTAAPRSELDVMNQTRVEDLFVSGIATIGGAEITPGGGGSINVNELNVSGVATINVGILTEAVIGVATITNADITFADIDESVTGLATITDLVGTAATIGVLDVTTITIDGIDAEVAVIRDLTVTGFSTLADMSAEDATFDSITVTDLSVTGPTTATSIEATTVSASSSITTPLASITDAIVGTSSVTTANVGFVTFIDAVGTALTVHEFEAFRGKFEFIEFESGGGGGGSGGGTGINSTSVTTQDLLVTGIATFTTGFTTHLTAEGISAGVVTATDIVSSGVSTLATIKNVDLTVSGVATINHEEVGSSVIGVATITNLDATTVNIDGIDADVVVTNDLVAGVATITKLEATDTVGTAATFQNLNFVSGVGTHLVLVSEEVGVSTIGILSAGDVTITNLIVTGDTNLGVTSGIVIIDGPATISGVVTIGDNSITLDGRQGREYIELGTGSGVRIAGLNTFTNAQSYVEVFNGLFTNLDVSGISTLGSVGVDTLTVSELTVDEITATDAVVGTATITSAEIGDASVGFITATDIVATAVTSYKGNFDILEFGEGPSGGGTGIDSTSIQTENLLISGIATINSGIFTSIQSETIAISGDLSVGGATTITSLDATTINATSIDITNLTAEVGAITNLINENLVSSGIATLNEVVAGILTVGELDANVIQIDNVDADNAVIGLATITEELVGVSTIGFADITDARIGAATITNLTATTIDIDGIDGEVGRLVDLEVTGIATIADLEAGNTRLGITTITGFLDVVGYTTVSGDLTIGGNLQVEGDLSYDEVNGRNANITGIGTVNDLNWTTAVGGALTVTGNSDLAHVDAESLSVSGLSTFVGVATFQDDIYIGGNLYVEGDLAYDEVNGRNANITGVGTVNVLNWNEAVGGALTVNGSAIFTDSVQITNKTLFADTIDVTGVVTASNLILDDADATAQIAGGLNVAKLTTVNDLVGASGTFTDLQVTNLDADGISIDGAVLETAEIVDLNVSGIATIANAQINSGIATLGRLEVNDLVGTAATFSELDVTNGGTLNIDSITATTGIFTALAVEQLGVTTISVTGFSTFAGDMYVGGIATIQSLKVGEIETLGGGGLNVDSIQTGDINVTGLSTFVGFATFSSDMFVGGIATITTLEVGEITSLGGGSLDVDSIKVTDLEVLGVSTFVGVATFQDDIYIGGNLNIQGDLSYDEVNGRNANITGVGTVNDLNWTTAVGGALTVTGHSDLDTLNVGGISTFVGVATFQSDIYIGGNLNIQGDLSYDEVNGRNANITGVGTVNRLYVTTDADVGRNFSVAGISTLNEVNANSLSVGFITATSGFIGVLTAISIDFNQSGGGIGTGGDSNTGISSQFITTPNLVVTGIATINHLDVETVTAGVVTAGRFVGMGSELTHLPPASFLSTEAPTIRPDGSPVQPGDLWFDSDDLRQFTRYAGVGTDVDIWVDSNPAPILPDLVVSDGISTSAVDLVNGSLDILATARQTSIVLTTVGPSTQSTSEFTVGLATDVQITNLEVTGVSTFIGVSTFKGDVYVDGNLIVGDQDQDLISGTNLLVSGIATIGTLGVTTDLTVGRNLDVVGIATVGTISAGDISLDEINASGSVSIGGSLTMEPAPTGEGGVYFDNSVVGMGTALIFDSASVGGDLGVGNSLGVVGDAYLDGNIVGNGGTISGYNDIASPLIRANLVSTLEVATNFISAGDISVVGVTTTSALEVYGVGVSTDYSTVTLSGLSPSSFDQTYVRQSTGFTLDTGTVASGNAQFNADSNYYYYVATTGVDPTSRILIWSVSDNAWMAVYDFNGTNFSEGNVTNNQALGFSGIFDDTVTANTSTDGGRNIPQAGASVVYATGGTTINTTLHSSGDAEFTGIVTAAGFVGGTLEVLTDASINRNLSVGGASTFVGNTTTFGDATFKQDVIIEGSLSLAGGGGGGGISTDGTTGITSTSISTKDLYVSGIATAQTGDILGDLLVRGNARVVGVVTAENFDSLSDRRYKENIRPIENALDKVADLNGIHFDYKNSGNKSMGLIAQDVQKVFPECVSGKDPISVNYNGIIGALVEAVKELKDQNEQLRKDIDELKKS